MMRHKTPTLPLLPNLPQGNLNPVLVRTLILNRLALQLPPSMMRLQVSNLSIKNPQIRMRTQHLLPRRILKAIPTQTTMVRNTTASM